MIYAHVYACLSVLIPIHFPGPSPCSLPYHNFVDLWATCRLTPMNGNPVLRAFCPLSCNYPCASYNSTTLLPKPWSTKAQ